jgi:hypothetical protein
MGLPSHKPGDFSQPSIQMLLFDAQTGDLRGYNALDSAMGNSLLCFTRKEGYGVYAIKEGKAAKQVVPLS